MGKVCSICRLKSRIHRVCSCGFTFTAFLRVVWLGLGKSVGVIFTAVRHVFGLALGLFTSRIVVIIEFVLVPMGLRNLVSFRSCHPRLRPL
ncbi:hypothetical protein BaRGS_00036496 [Batillaria attramentaria]|uniref:Uncharacterized protein n=1 Tax=Batillaria attramentaria TaxID=370345 RepID=A0ABD0JBN3_9CAEN